ncbi:MAG: M28 family metallopeptidase, partial [Woeseiaceae bacterium]
PADDNGNDANIPLELITIDGLRSHVEWLADDVREGRLAGSPGHEASAEYVVNFFAELGLEPAGEEGWLQQVPLITYQIDTENNAVNIHRDGVDRALNYRDDYAMGGDTVRAEDTVRGEVVYVGFGVHAPDLGYSDYDGIDVDDRIVAMFGGAPSTFEHDQRAYYASGRTKRQEAVARGAIGTIFLFSRHDERRIPWERVKRTTGKQPAMAWVNLSGEAADYFPQLRGSISLSADAATGIMAASPITFEAARDAIESDTVASVPLGFEASLSRRTIHDRIQSPNVIGMVRGTDPELSKEFVVYSAHLDGVGIEHAPDGDDTIRNGAYDNAMGISIMLETARVMAADPPKRSVLFVAVTAEERGLLGSDYFAHYPTVPADSIVANVNVDMPLFLYPVADLVAFGAEHSSLDAVAEAAARAEGFALTPNPLPEENLFVRSDQYSFVRQGIPAIYFEPGFTSADPAIDGEELVRDHMLNHYHKVSDDLSRPVDWDSVERFTRAHVRIGYDVADNPNRPEWNEGDFFAERFVK